MCTLDVAEPLPATRIRLRSLISSCSSSNKPRSWSVIASYNLHLFSDQCEDGDNVTDLVCEDDLDPDCDPEDDPVSVNCVSESLDTPYLCLDSCNGSHNNFIKDCQLTTKQ